MHNAFELASMHSCICDKWKGVGVRNIYKIKCNLNVYCASDKHQKTHLYDERNAITW